MPRNGPNHASEPMSDNVAAAEIKIAASVAAGRLCMMSLAGKRMITMALAPTTPVIWLRAPLASARAGAGAVSARVTNARPTAARGEVEHADCCNRSDDSDGQPGNEQQPPTKREHDDERTHTDDCRLGVHGGVGDVSDEPPDLPGYTAG